MASYLDKLSPAQKANASLLLNEMKSQGITNPFTHASVLAVVSKETEFNPSASEVSYAGTKNDRIRSIFSKTRKLTDPQLDALKKDPKKFFDFVYDGVAGNGPLDGYKYRGRGFNQLTGRANYANIAKLTGIDLVNNPDLLTQPEVASKAMVAYFKNGINTLDKIGKLSWYNAKDINDFKSLNDSLGAIYHVNAGAGHGKAHLDADVTGGRAKAMSRVQDLFKLTGAPLVETATATVEAVKKNPMKTALLMGGLALGILLMIKAFNPETK